jgi:hypothetical protein
MYTVDILQVASSPMPSEAAKLASAFIGLAVSVALVWSIFVIEDRKTIREFITDKKEPESEDESESEYEYEEEQEQDQEEAAKEVEPEEIPMGEPLRRMCDFGCCPYGESLTSYYNKFTTPALAERKSDCDKQRDFTGEEYAKAKEAYYFAKENLAAVTHAYNHVINSADKVNEIYEMRVMDDQLDGHTKEDMYSMLAAVHQWKAFDYAPQGLFPYQKELWEKVLLKKIYTN